MSDVSLVLERRSTRFEEFLVGIPLFLAGYVFSRWLLSVYVAGDQQSYASYWNAVSWSYPWQWNGLQLIYVGSSDILYSFIIGFGTYTGLDRIDYISLWNGFFVALVGQILFRYRASIIFYLLIFTNFYFLVLLGSAERLKFAYIFLILAIYIDGVIGKVISSIASVFTHTQSLVQFFMSFTYYISTEYKNIIKNRLSFIAIFVIFPCISLGVGYYLYNIAGEVITRKSEFYGEQSQGLLEIVQWIMIVIVGFSVYDKKLPFLVSMMPAGVLTYFYGNRINVATLAFFCILALLQKKTLHPLVLLVMAYMSFKSIGFIEKTLATGQGF